MEYDHEEELEGDGDGEEEKEEDEEEENEGRACTSIIHGHSSGSSGRNLDIEGMENILEKREHSSISKRERSINTSTSTSTSSASTSSFTFSSGSSLTSSVRSITATSLLSGPGPCPRISVPPSASEGQIRQVVSSQGCSRVFIVKGAYLLTYLPTLNFLHFHHFLFHSIVSPQFIFRRISVFQFLTLVLSFSYLSFSFSLFFLLFSFSLYFHLSLFFYCSALTSVLLKVSNYVRGKSLPSIFTFKKDLVINWLADAKVRKHGNKMKKNILLCIILCFTFHLKFSISFSISFSLLFH